MDVRLSPEQESLRDAAARIVDRLGPHAVGEIGDRERVARLDAAVTDSGWRELRTGTDGDAPLASGVEVAIVAEALGRGLADVSFFGPTMASELRRMAGVPPSTAVETVALSADLSSIAYSVDGEIPPCVAIDVQGSDRSILLAAGSEGLQVAPLVVRSDSAGVDLTRPSVVIGPPVVATTIETAASPITTDDRTRWTALGLSLACADLVGTMCGAVQLATDYASQRHQYGAAIGSFQSIQHLLADAFVLSEGARSATLHAAWAVDALAPAAALGAASVAKVYCSRAARTVCETAIQVHGGVGNTWECLAHVYLRRALLSSDLLGDAGVAMTQVLQYNGIGGTDGLR